MPEFTTLINGLSFTECPRWHNGRLYFSDFYTFRVLAVSMDGALETIAHVPQQPAGLGFLPDGRLLIVSMRDRKILRREHDGTLAVHADLYHLAPWHLNDMLVDYDGRAWVGNFGFDLHGGVDPVNTVLICVDPDGTARIAAEDLAFPNGTVLFPDRRTLVVAETIADRLTAFTVQGNHLTERRVWARFGDPPKGATQAEMLPQLQVCSDGICLDGEGAIWVADALKRRLLRVAEGGRILEELSTGEQDVFACMLGGPDGCTLFACVSQGFDERGAAERRKAGVIATRVNVPRAGLP